MIFESKQIFMNPETTSFIIGISGFIMVALLAIIAYFLKQFIDSVNDFKLSLQKLQVIVREEKMRFSSFQANHFEKHKEIDRRLNSHAERLDIHFEKLAKINIQ
jgi:hypothetical protein